MKITDTAAADILDRAMVARIATVSKNDRPHVNPLYFVVDDGHLHLGTATYTLAAHNVRANSLVQILFESEAESDDPRALRVDGSASIRTEASLMKCYRRGVARKYIVTPRGLWNMLVHPHQWRPTRQHLRGGAACVIDVTPTDINLLEVGLEDLSAD